MAEQQTATCPECSRTISPEDTIVFHFGILGHLDCRRPRVLSAEERSPLASLAPHQPRPACNVAAVRDHSKPTTTLQFYAHAIRATRATSIG
jgi:hypothetical protein